MPSQNIWIAASDNDIAAVGQFLSRDPASVNARDENGSSYNHIPLLRSLVQNHAGDPNVTDHDGDTPLFVVETVETARCLVEELGADVAHRNSVGLTAVEAIQADGQLPLVAAYLREREALVVEETAAAAPGTNGALHAPPTPPAGLEVNYSAMDESDDAPVDSELRRKIEELAQRGDFESNEAQRELRELVTGALRDHGIVDSDTNRNVRTRQDDGP